MNAEASEDKRCLQWIILHYSLMIPEVTVKQGAQELFTYPAYQPDEVRLRAAREYDRLTGESLQSEL